MKKMFIELHAPNGEKIYHNIDHIIAVGLDDRRRTVLFYGNTEFVVQETVDSVMALIELVKIASS